MDRKSLIKKLDKLIRPWFISSSRRDRRGYYQCPLVNQWYPASEMQVAHFIDRKIQSTRYEKDNLIFCSKSSNIWDAQKMVEGYKSQHHKDFEEHLGPEKVDKLVSMSKTLEPLTIDQLKHYIDEYTCK